MMPGREHTLDKRKVHHKWDKRNPPALEIESGDTVHCETAEVTNNQVTPGCPASALGRIDFSQLYPLAGPIYVKSAEPGDMLQVDILRLEPLAWGWSGIIPGLGLLAEDFDQPYIRHFDLSNGSTAPLRDDIQIPIQPFCGTMGVATDEDGPLDYFKMFYADTALFGAYEATVCGLAFFGAGHVLFASDAPFDPEKGPMYIRETIAIVDRLPISDEERERIYWRNAAALLKLD